MRSGREAYCCICSVPNSVVPAIVKVTLAKEAILAREGRQDELIRVIQLVGVGSIGVHVVAYESGISCCSAGKRAAVS